MFEAWPSLLYSTVTAMLNGFVIVGGLMLIKSSRSWLAAFAVTVGAIIALMLLSVAGYFLQGYDRAMSILSPMGELFPFVFAPNILHVVINTSLIMFVAYGLFVASGNQKSGNQKNV